MVATMTASGSTVAGGDTSRGVKPFNTDTRLLLNFRTFIAAKLFKHPQNTLNSAEEFQKLLRSS